MRTLPNPFRCALGGGSNDYLACRPICLLVAGCLCVSSLRTTFSGMRLFACWAPCGGGRRFFGGSVGVGASSFRPWSFGLPHIQCEWRSVCRRRGLCIKGLPHPERVGAVFCGIRARPLRLVGRRMSSFLAGWVCWRTRRSVPSYFSA